MRPRSTLFSIFLVCLATLQAQDPERFVKAYGLESTEDAHNVLQLTDGGFLMVGTTNGDISAGGTDAYAVRTTAQGDLQWAKSFGGPGDEWGTCIAVAGNGAVVVVGNTTSFDGGTSMPYVLQVDAGGEPLWMKTYAGGIYDHGELSAVAAVPGGGFILAGTRVNIIGVPAVLVIRTDADGDTLWTSVFERSTGATVNGASSVKVTSDGGCVLACNFSPEGALTTEGYLVKLAADGSVQWARSTSDGNWPLSDACQTSDDGFLAIGTYSGWGYYVPRVVRFNALGDTVWTHEYTSILSGSRPGSALCVLPDNSFILNGYAVDSTGVASSPYLLHADPNGQILWAKRMSGTPEDQFHGIMAAADGDVVVCGATHAWGINTDASLVKVADDPYGCNTSAISVSNGSVASTSEPVSLALSHWPGAGLLRTAQSASGGLTYNGCIGSGLVDQGTSAPFTMILDAASLLVSNAPVGDTYSLFDGVGRVLREGSVPSEMFSIGLSGIRAGAYTLRIMGLTRMQAKRLVITQ